MLLVLDGWLTCHTFPLVARSQVFRAMFNHDMRERNENKVLVPFYTTSVVDPDLHGSGTFAWIWIWNSENSKLDPDQE